MNVVEQVRLWSDGRTSIHDMRALIESMGYSRAEVAEAITQVWDEPGTELRVGSYRKGEWFAELYLTSQQNKCYN